MYVILLTVTNIIIANVLILPFSPHNDNFDIHEIIAVISIIIIIIIIIISIFAIIILLLLLRYYKLPCFILCVLFFLSLVLTL
jgi:hypothetical protein